MSMLSSMINWRQITCISSFFPEIILRIFSFYTSMSNVFLCTSLRCLLAFFDAESNFFCLQPYFLVSRDIRSLTDFISPIDESLLFVKSASSANLCKLYFRSIDFAIFYIFRCPRCVSLLLKSLKSYQPFLWLIKLGSAISEAGDVNYVFDKGINFIGLFRLN